MNVAITHNEYSMILEHRDKYKEEVIKDKFFGICEPKNWTKFEKKIHDNILRASILHIYNGIELPIKIISQAREKNIVEFRGFESYTQKGDDLKEIFKELQNSLLNGLVHRLDICLDFSYKPYKVLKELKKIRIPTVRYKTTYFKTESEKSKNNYFDIAYYHKKQEVYRVEFRFKKSFLKNVTLKDIEKVFGRIEKTISKCTKLTVKIESPLCSE
ncbi:hypothetical protein [Aliarcobacter cryaerophilus]|uniref:hypothetical protein n=1 Tax=Aliarcobacter cryaerophilus TaxID=28198 RepID=UPI003DA5958B